MSREERINPIRREDYTFCDVCGRKVPLNQIGGQCVSCGRRACTRCTVMINDRIYCKDCGEFCQEIYDTLSSDGLQNC